GLAHPPAFQHQRPVGGHAGHRLQALQWQAVDRPLPGGAVNTHVGGVLGPAPGWSREVAGALVVAHPGPEVLFDVADSALDLALGLGPLGATELGSEAVVAGEVEQARVEDRMGAFVVASPDRLGAVGENR